MHSLTLLLNIAVALAAAICGGVVARRLGLPTIVGYLFAGVAIGPFTPGFVGDVYTISELAELGVIFLMFGVGLHFSLRDLWAVRNIAIPGAVGQMAIATALGYGLTQLWGWSVAASLVMGLAISVASTVVLLRGLMDNGLLNTPHGRVAVGWLVLEDIATVIILVLLPALVPSNQGDVLGTTGVALLKAAAFAALMLFVGARFMPWLLMRIVHTRSRELFIVTIVAIALGTAVGSAEIFGVSLALGAFLAGVVVSGNQLSHQIEAEVVPFRETFAVLFFVSVGMLVNPLYLLENAGQVIALTLLIVLGKALISAVLVFIFPYPVRTALVIAAGLSQIGEFSFIVGQTGVSLGLLNQDQYSLILAGALLSITVNPLMFRAITPVENFLRRYPALWERLDRHGPAPAPIGESLHDHVVVVGYGRVGQHIITVLRQLETPHLVIDIDPARIAELESQGVTTLFGDAANSELITHAKLDKARLLVVTLPDETATETIVAAAHDLAPDLNIIARAATSAGLTHLEELGARDVIHPELEGGLEIVRYALLRLGFPPGDVSRYTDAVRRDHYDTSISSPDEQELLQQLMKTVRGIDVQWVTLEVDSPVIGQTLAEVNVRARTGASVIAIAQNGHMLANPKSATVFQSGDQVGLIGEPEQVAEAQRLLTPAQPMPEIVASAAAT